MDVNENQQQLVLNLSASDEVAPVEIQTADAIDENQLENSESPGWIWTTNLLSEVNR